MSIATAEELIMTNRKVKVSEIAKELQVLAGVLKTCIVHYHLFIISSYVKGVVSLGSLLQNPCTIGIEA